MDFTFVAEGVNAVVVDNFYTEQEYSLILKQCLDCIPQLRTEEETASALDGEGNPIKKNHGGFVESTSDMAKLMQERIYSIDFRDQIINSNSLYRILYSCTKINTLLSYYTDGDFYEPHVDDSIFTAIFYAYKEPKKFSGGEINLHSYIQGKVVTIQPYPNRLILFPSVTLHSVNAVSMDNKEEGYGRFAVSQFIEYESQRK